MTANSHQRTRDDHASETAEDYVEAIADAIAKNGVCRSVDLVNFFSVTHATVNRTVARLQRDGYVTTAAYQPIELTEAGRRLATQSRRRHAVVYAFLRAMGVSESSAAADSEGIEHHVSDETLAMMKRVVEKGWPQA
ncbi:MULTISPECIES: manganese-binding transcriptional regulator MntR [Crateriforma]|uniref:Transcriptional regulator MntR n=1 Tax=Crateriforma conspicua TaxID=2527996 RepID=A0A5C6FQD8_9PLAN|nr:MULTISPECIES: manganese-binding transcriptional regulator MntR [Crateriforma]TWU65347.1 Transcriptional regulator MntR [Crateriforma conspicua]